VLMKSKMTVINYING